MKHIKLIAIVGLVLALLAATTQAKPRKFFGPMEAEERVIIRSQIPTREMGVHPQMAVLMRWALGQSDELTVLSGLQDTARLKITDLNDEVAALVDDPRPLVQTTAVQTLGALDAQSAADRLVALASTENPAPRQVEQIEMADSLLARWGDLQAVPAWAARLNNPDALLPLRTSAARALGAGIDGDDAAAQAMIDVVMNADETPSLRNTAARSLGMAVPAGLESHAEQLAGGGMFDRLLASQVLLTHSGADALDILTDLANDEEPAVQAPALKRLLETEPRRLWPTAATLAGSYDPKVRLAAVQSAMTWHDLEPVGILGTALDDPHPEVRNEARSVMFQLATTHDDLNQPVKNEIRRWLETAVAERTTLGEYETRADPNHAAHWRAAEQAALLAGDLDDKTTNDALLKLVSQDVEHPRLDVRIAAVASVRKLHVPASRPFMVDMLRRMLVRMEQRANATKDRSQAADGGIAINNKPDSELTAEVAQTMARWNVTESDPLLRELIPKHPKSGAFPRARASAIWALGYLHKDQCDEGLAQLLNERLHDLNPLDPEAHDVRMHSAMAIGRMRCESFLEFLRGRYDVDGLEIKATCRWAIILMTGEDPGAIILEPGLVRDGFIQPLD